MRLPRAGTALSAAFTLLLFARAIDIGNATASPIYHGGPILTAPVDVYYIYYGRWLGGLPFRDPDIVVDFSNLDTFIPNLSGSSYANILTSYGATDQFNFYGQTIISPGDPLYEGNDLDANPNNLTGSIETIVTSALAANRLPTDPNGVYFVVTDPFINIPGFGNSAPIGGGVGNFCAWHSSTNWYTNTLGTQYGFIGDPGPAVSGCGQPIQYVPDVNFEAYAMENEIAHELFETITDPTGGGYWDSISPLGSATRGDEMADICAWNFGPTHEDSEGGNANVNLNGTDYLLQQQWHNEGGGVGYSGGECVQGLTMTMPEPATLSLFGAGSVYLVVLRRRRRKSFPNLFCQTEMWRGDQNPHRRLLRHRIRRGIRMRINNSWGVENVIHKAVLSAVRVVLFAVAAILTARVMTPNAFASPIFVTSGGYVTGIDGVYIPGSVDYLGNPDSPGATYDIRFVAGMCSTVYGSCQTYISGN